MKKILIIALSVIMLSSCTSNALLVKRYDDKFAYKVYDGVLLQLFYTNTITFHDGYIEFIDHDGVSRKVSEYSIKQLEILEN